MDLAPTQSGLQAALRAFLSEVLPEGVEIIAGVVNRVPEPSVARFVVFNPLRMERLRTNVDTSADTRFTGSIAGTAMTVSAVSFGTIQPGAIVFGTGVVANTRVMSGPGGVGSYVVNKPQTLSSQVLSAGQMTVEQGVKATVQLDFHSADNTASDMAQTVSTLLRDPYGVEQFANQDPNYGVVPLYADDPRFIPFTNENQQVEWRWVLEACFQLNQVTKVPQQFADEVKVGTVSAGAAS
jgi:hypothetical protein